MRVLHVVGARPNFMKVAPVMRALAVRSCDQTLVHTGQHYDINMSDVFFQQLQIPHPDINLNVGSGTHAQQTAEIMSRIEPVLLERRPNIVLVYGDVNSTVAAALVCAKIGIRLGHVEAGLRSFDREMPEEINRLVTDQLSDLLFTPSHDGNQNLSREGIPPEKIHLVGNVMIDTLIHMLPAARSMRPTGLPERYVLVTLHRPSNVDDVGWFSALLEVLAAIGQQTPVIFPVHPRTRQRLVEGGIMQALGNGISWRDPLPYLEFLSLQLKADLVITDSGGIQEETTYLQIPCLTVRENTERPITISMGTNELVGRDPEKLRAAAEAVLGGRRKPCKIPSLWDGKAGERIAEVLIES